MKRYDKVSTYIKENIVIVIFLALTGTCFNGLMWLLPILEGKTINSLYTGDRKLVITLVITLIGFVLFVQINRFFKRFLVRVFGNRIALRMRKISLNCLLNKDFEFFATSSAGDILNRNLTDIYDTTEGIRKMTTEIFDTFILLLGYLVSMFVLDYAITLIVLVPLALAILIAQFLKVKIYKANKSYKEYLSYNKELNITLLNNELYYRGFGVSDRFDKDYEESVEILRKKNLKALILQSSMEPLYQAIALLGLLAIVIIGAKNVINGVYLIGTLSAYITTYLLVAKKASKVGKVFNAYQAYKVSFDRAKEFLRQEEDKKIHCQLKGNELVLKDFVAYNEKITLPAIDMTLKPGDIVGICGLIHSGKSTLLKAISGYCPYQGKANLGNCDIKDLTKSADCYVGLAPGEVALFSDTLKNNITLGRTGKLDTALKASGLDLDIRRLGGLESKIAHSNANISGGQAKRLGMARCLYEAKILILLDDPFQSVNPDLALKMYQNLVSLYQDKIIIFVSNNKELLIRTSRIVFLDGETYTYDRYQNLLSNEKFLALMGEK